MAANSDSREAKAKGHPTMTQGGVAPVKTATDTWVTPHPAPDVTQPSTLPKAVANTIDGKDHSDDPVVPDQGGKVVDHMAADANRRGR